LNGSARTRLPRKSPYRGKFLSQFTNILVLLLLAAALVSATLWLYERDSALPYEAMARGDQARRRAYRRPFAIRTREHRHHLSDIHRASPAGRWVRPALRHRAGRLAVTLSTENGWLAVAAVVTVTFMSKPAGVRDGMRVDMELSSEGGSVTLSSLGQLLPTGAFHLEATAESGAAIGRILSGGRSLSVRVRGSIVAIPLAGSEPHVVELVTACG
jgi:hypothetical protein